MDFLVVCRFSGPEDSGSTHQCVRQAMRSVAIFPGFSLALPFDRVKGRRKTSVFTVRKTVFRASNSAASGIHPSLSAVTMRG